MKVTFKIVFKYQLMYFNPRKYHNRILRYSIQSNSIIFNRRFSIAIVEIIFNMTFKKINIIKSISSRIISHKAIKIGS
jgi:hypothetical protein